MSLAENMCPNCGRSTLESPCRACGNETFCDYCERCILGCHRTSPSTSEYIERSRYNDGEDAYQEFLSQLDRVAGCVGELSDLIAGDAGQRQVVVLVGRAKGDTNGNQ